MVFARHLLCFVCYFAPLFIASLFAGNPALSRTEPSPTVRQTGQTSEEAGSGNSSVRGSAALEVPPATVVAIVLTGDGDPFIDNCEAVRVNFVAHNSGGTTLTNLQISSLVAANEPNLVLLNPYPFLTPSTLEPGHTAVGDFAFFAADLAPGADLVFELGLSADELANPVMANLTLINTEGDFSFQSFVNYSFESGMEGWTATQGTFVSSTTFGGSPGGTHAMVSSSGLDNQCDEVRSPRFHLNESSTISLFTHFDIQDFDSSWHDRANVGLYDLVGQVRLPIAPDSGRAYSATGEGGACLNQGQDGWAGTATTWSRSTWSSSLLQNAGLVTNLVQMDVVYATDEATAGTGFRFDQVVLTDVDLIVADNQSDSCVSNQQPQANDDEIALQEAQYLDVLVNDSDPDQDSLRILLVAPPLHGTASIIPVEGADRLYYFPGEDYQGSDQFEYMITDGKGNTDTAMVTLSYCTTLGESYPYWPQFSVLNLITCVNAAIAR